MTQFVAAIEKLVSADIRNKVGELARNRRGDYELQLLSQIMTATMTLIMENFSPKQIDEFNQSMAKFFTEEQNESDYTN